MEDCRPSILVAADELLVVIVLFKLAMAEETDAESVNVDALIKVID